MNSFDPERNIPERIIEGYLVTRVKNLRGKAYKFSSPMQRGVSDRIVLFPNGKLYFVELKRRVGQQTPLQKTFEKEVTRLGQKYLICRSKEEVDKFIEEAMA